MAILSFWQSLKSTSNEADLLKKEQELAAIGQSNVLLSENNSFFINPSIFTQDLEQLNDVVACLLRAIKQGLVEPSDDSTVAFAGRLLKDPALAANDSIVQGFMYLCQLKDYVAQFQLLTDINISALTAILSAKGAFRTFIENPCKEPHPSKSQITLRSNIWAMLSSPSALKGIQNLAAIEKSQLFQSISNIAMLFSLGDYSGESVALTHEHQLRVAESFFVNTTKAGALLKTLSANAVKEVKKRSNYTQVADFFSSSFARHWLQHYLCQNNSKFEAQLNKGLQKVFDELDDAWALEVWELKDFCNTQLSAESICKLFEKRVFSELSQAAWYFFENKAQAAILAWKDYDEAAVYLQFLNPAVYNALQENFRSIGLHFAATDYYNATRLSCLKEHCAVTEAMIEAAKNAWQQHMPQQSFDALPDFQKIAYFYFLLDYVVALPEAFDQLHAIEKALTIRGWTDLIRALPNSAKWLVVMARAAQYPVFATFCAHPNLEADIVKQITEDKWVIQNLSFSQFNPYDARGGFCLNTFIAIVKFLEATKPEDEKKNKWWRVASASVCSALLQLTYLFGQDIVALKKAIEDYAQEHNLMSKKLTVAAHDFGQFSIPDIGAEAIKVWRPLLIKHRSLLDVVSGLTPTSRPSVGMRVEDLRHALCHNTFEGVPDHLKHHMPHAVENGWDQEIVDEFVYIACRKKRTAHDIKQHVLKTADCQLRLLDSEDPTALYIGELSGCCQHINEGAGNDAAIQSFTETWCGVLVVESLMGKKLHLQSFVWLDKPKQSLVLDSLESIYDEGDSFLEESVYPAMLNWISEALTAGLYNSVLIGDTDYGVTHEFWQYCEQHSRELGLLTQNVGVPAAAGVLEYTDVENNCLKISIAG